MLISVVIPVYNVEKYLPQCLDSVVNQTYKDLEIICVNDASTDSSLKILEEYAQKDSRIKIISNPENLGLGLARNEGLKIATGKYIHCLDSDDWLELNAYETISKTLNYNPNLDVIHFKYRVYNTNNNNTTEIPVARKDLGLFMRSYNFENNPEIINLYTTSAWTKVIRREFILDNNLFYNNYRCLEDIEYSLELILRAKNILFLAQVLINYRENRDGSLMQKRFDYLDNLVKDTHNAEIKAKKLPPKAQMYYLGFIYKKVIEIYHEAYSSAKISFEEIYNTLKSFNIESLIKNRYILPKHHYGVLCFLEKEFKSDINNLKIPKKINKSKYKNKILLSIIIPVYNVEKYLELCLNSVLEQTYENLEIICINDCATDSSTKILEKYAKLDSRIKIIHHEKNSGLGAARNTGLDAASGDYIHFLDSDDWIIHKEAYENLVKSLEEHNLPDILQFNFRNSVWGVFDSQPVFHINKDLVDKVIIPRKTIESYDNWSRYVWTKLFKKDFLTKNHIKFSLIRSMEDLQYSADTFVKCETLCYVDDLVLDYTRARPGSLVSKSYTVFKEIVDTFKYNANLYEHLPDGLKYRFLGLDYYQIRINIDLAYQMEIIDENYLNKLEKYLDNFEVEKFLCSDLKPGEGTLKIDFDKIRNEIIPINGDLSKNKNIVFLSVILPIYNVENYLREALDSIINQTYKYLEIICINDCSTDSCAKILKEYQEKDSRIIIINNKKNLGVGKSRNIGLQKAKGEYIHFLDPDDIIINLNKYKELIEALIEYNKPDILHFHYANHKYDSQNFWIEPQNNKSLYNKVIRPRETIEAYDNWSRYVWTKFYKKEFLDSNNIEFSGIRALSDYRYSADTYVKCETLCYINNIVINYTRERPHSLVSTIPNIIGDIYDEFAYNAKLYENLPDELKYKFLGMDYLLIYDYTEKAYKEGSITKKDIHKLQNILKDFDIKNFVFTELKNQKTNLELDFDKILSSPKS